jgi:hypothetical protein
MVRCNVGAADDGVLYLWSLGGVNTAGGDEVLRRKQRKRGRGGLEGVSAQASANRASRSVVAPAGRSGNSGL